MKFIPGYTIKIYKKVKLAGEGTCTLTPIDVTNLKNVYNLLISEEFTNYINCLQNLNLDSSILTLAIISAGLKNFMPVYNETAFTHLISSYKQAINDNLKSH